MNFVEDDELDVTNQVGAFVQHTSKNFSRHNEAAGLRIYLHISGQDSDGGCGKCLLEIPELLVGQRLDWRGVDGSIEKINEVKKESSSWVIPGHMFF